jgi:hypothetical protein
MNEKFQNEERKILPLSPLNAAPGLLFGLAHQNRRFRVSYWYQRGMLRHHASTIIFFSETAGPSNLVSSILVTVTLKFAHDIFNWPL